MAIHNCGNPECPKNGKDVPDNWREELITSLVVELLKDNMHTMAETLKALGADCIVAMAIFHPKDDHFALMGATRGVNNMPDLLIKTALLMRDNPMCIMKTPENVKPPTHEAPEKKQ